MGLQRSILTKKKVKKYLTKNNVLLAAIVFGALISRTIYLSVLPQGFHVDEAKVAWNAYSILKTGADDWGNRFDLHYNTFGDFRPTGIFYLSIPFIQLLGLSVFSVRLTGAVIGVGCVLAVYFLAKIVSNNRTIATTAAVLMAFSPWQVVISRATSEVIMASFFMILGLYFLIKGLKEKRIAWLVAAVIVILPSYFLYHTARVLTTLYVFVVCLYYLKDEYRHYSKKFLIAVGATIGITICITGLFAVNNRALARYDQISIPHMPEVQKFIEDMPYEEGENHVLRTRAFHNKIVVYAHAFVTNYISYISPNFLLLSDQARPNRYATVDNGLITYVEFVLFLIGIWFMAKKKLPSLPLLLLVLAPIPAALTTDDTPNLHRAFLMSPFLCIIGGYGFTSLLKIRIKLAFTFVALFYCINALYFWHMYSVHNAVHMPLFLSRNIGALEAASYIKEQQPHYDLIYVTNYPDEFYPWYAIVAQPDPKAFNALVANRGLSPNNRKPFQWQNVVFTKLHCPSEIFLNNPPGNVLAIDGEGCQPNYSNIVIKVVDQYKRESGGSPYIYRVIDRSPTPSP